MAKAAVWTKAQSLVLSGMEVLMESWMVYVNKKIEGYNENLQLGLKS